MGKENRTVPSEVVVGGMKLPHLTPCSLPADKKYHGTNEAAAIGMERQTPVQMNFEGWVYLPFLRNSFSWRKSLCAGEFKNFAKSSKTNM